MFHQDSEKFEHFFVESFCNQHGKKVFVHNVDNVSAIIAVGSNPAIVESARRFFSSENPQDVDSFSRLLSRFFWSDSIRKYHQEIGIAILFIHATEQKLWYFNHQMPPIVIQNFQKDITEITASTSTLKEEGFDKSHILFFPLQEVASIFIPSNQLGYTHYRSIHEQVFSRKDIIHSFLEKGEELLQDKQRFSFALANFQVGQNIESSRQYQIPATMKDVERVENDLENTLLDYFPKNDMGARAIIVLNEFLLNAYEHGVLGVDAKTKQHHMEQGTYDEHLRQLEKKRQGHIDLLASFYRNGVFEVTIDDHGEGFDINKHVTPTGESDYRGRGITMSYNIADAVFFSNKGSRVTFYFKFPLENAADAAEVSISDEALLKQMRVLYVEDESLIRQLFQGLISRHVKGLYVGEDGREGLELFEKYQPDAVITDISMPHLDGLEMSRAIKKINPKTPIVLTTAHDHENLLEEALKIGIDKILIKPTDINKLKKVLANLARKHSAHSDESLLKRQRELTDIRAKVAYNDNQQKKAFEKQKLIIHDDSEAFRYIKCRIYYHPLEILSGDIYGLHRLGTAKSFLCIVDCMGKGLVASVSAVLAASFINQTILDYQEEKKEFNLKQIATRFGNFMSAHLLDEECLSFSMTYLDKKTSRIEHIGFGMYPTILKDLENGKLELIRSENPPFMKGDHEGEKTLTVHTLPASFEALTYSDGICEFENFSYKNLLEIVKNHQGFDAILEAIQKHINFNDHSNLIDDITMLHITDVLE